MNSSYFGVPGRGGTSAGMPPSHKGRASPAPASEVLIVLQPPRMHAGSAATASRTASWRGLMGIGGASEPLCRQVSSGDYRADRHSAVKERFMVLIYHYS